MKILASAILSFSLIQQTSFACPISGAVMSRTEKTKLEKSLKSLTKLHRSPAQALLMPDLPDASSSAPWGGANSQNWKPEAILANATSRALNLAWKEKNLVDALIAVPVQMIYTNNRVYCDGQTNASLTFGNWSHKEPQIVASLLTFKDDTRKVKFLFSKNLNLKELKMSLIAFIPSTNETPKRFDASIDLTAAAEGIVGSWDVPSNIAFGDLTSSRVLWLKPNGWSDAFPIDFRMTVLSTKELLQASPEKKMAKSQSLLDPLAIRSDSQKNKKLSLEQLLATSYGPAWDQHNKGAYEPNNIHAEVESNSQKFSTATGKGWTWVANRNQKENVPFKNLYTCFDKRNYSSESILGVPSGGGWHEIGDAAETIINNIETSPVVVGMATGVPWPTPPDSSGFAWGLKDVAVIRFLKPDEALITAAGDQTWREDANFRVEKEKNPDACGRENRAKGDGGGRNYHWFYFHHEIPVCTQEWVHNCVPNEKNSFGLDCKL